MTAVELYQELQKHFKVIAAYRVGFSHELSPGVLEVIKHLKGDLAPQDIAPMPTDLTIAVKDLQYPHSIVDTFHQSSSVYMPAFDATAFESWAEWVIKRKQAETIIND